MLIGRYRALLDTCVLHPAFLRGALLWYADERLFQPRWSGEIMREWRESVVRRFPDMGMDALDRQLAIMDEAFPAATITGYEPFVEAFQLPDPDDRHVLAAAMIGKCSGIVTANLRDFPPPAAAPLEIEIVHPDTFIVNIIDLEPRRALEACRRHRASMTKTAPTPKAFLDRYRAAGLIQAHQRLQEYVGLI